MRYQKRSDGMKLQHYFYEFKETSKKTKITTAEVSYRTYVPDMFVEWLMRKLIRSNE
jgi:hypothetical protein